MQCVKVPFALRESDGRYVDATMVPSGLKCGCVCAACSTSLIARHPRTSKRKHHFAHRADLERPCKTALETSLHKAAKQIVSELESIWLPAATTAPTGRFTITEAHLEKPAAGVIPDVLVVNEPGRRIAIEIRVAHEVDQEKRLKLKAARLETVEIDLRKVARLILYEELLTLFRGETLASVWIYHEQDQRHIEEEMRAAEEARRKAAEDLLYSAELERKREEEAQRRRLEEQHGKWQQLMPWVFDPPSS